MIFLPWLSGGLIHCDMAGVGKGMPVEENRTLNALVSLESSKKMKSDFVFIQPLGKNTAVTIIH